MPTGSPFDTRASWCRRSSRRRDPSCEVTPTAMRITHHEIPPPSSSCPHLPASLVTPATPQHEPARFPPLPQLQTIIRRLSRSQEPTRRRCNPYCPHCAHALLVLGSQQWCSQRRVSAAHAFMASTVCPELEPCGGLPLTTIAVRLIPCLFCAISFYSRPNTHSLSSRRSPFQVVGFTALVDVHGYLFGARCRSCYILDTNMSSLYINKLSSPCIPLPWAEIECNYQCIRSSLWSLIDFEVDVTYDLPTWVLTWAHLCKWNSLCKAATYLAKWISLRHLGSLSSLCHLSKWPKWPKWMCSFPDEVKGWGTKRQGKAL